MNSYLTDGKRNTLLISWKATVSLVFEKQKEGFL